VADGRKELGHDPEKWKPVFGKDHAPTENLDPGSIELSQGLGRALANLPVKTVWLLDARQRHHDSSRVFGTSPNDFSTEGSPKSPLFGLPVRLKARAPALRGSRDICSARRIAADALGISCACPAAMPSSVLRNGNAT
jgi:hypothetical protein